MAVVSAQPPFFDRYCGIPVEQGPCECDVGYIGAFCDIQITSAMDALARKVMLTEAYFDFEMLVRASQNEWRRLCFSRRGDVDQFMENYERALATKRDDVMATPEFNALRKAHIGTRLFPVDAAWEHLQKASERHVC